VQAAKDPATANVLTYLALKNQDWAGAEEAIDDAEEAPAAAGRRARTRCTRRARSTTPTTRKTPGFVPANDMPTFVQRLMDGRCAAHAADGPTTLSPRRRG
jgi:hypothetical protein